MKTITEKHYEKAVGRPPENDDLERANCILGGELGHFSCGWSEEYNLPHTMTPNPKIIRGTK